MQTDSSSRRHVHRQHLQRYVSRASHGGVRHAAHLRALVAQSDKTTGTSADVVVSFLSSADREAARARARSIHQTRSSAPGQASAVARAAMQSLVTRNPRIAELVANAPKDSVEHRLLSQFESLFKGRKHFYLPSPIGTKRKTSPTKTDGSPRKRHALFAPVPGRLRCGYCNTCLNPRMKQACITRRNQMRSMTSVA